MEKYSFGVGDRFSHQAKFQLEALIKARELGVDVVPVWNKSNREHLIVGSEPASTRKAADEAVAALNWQAGYYCDADHIRLDTVDRYLPCCDFFTIDVADSIGSGPNAGACEAFLARHPELAQSSGEDFVYGVITKYGAATEEAGRIYRYICEKRGSDDFVTEVSMDETDSPQTPDELLIILAALGDENIPLQTIAPKFTGRFNKGVDFVGDLGLFEKEFNDDLAVIQDAVERFGLPASLKLSIHSGSDKFSLYPIINRALSRTGAGIHVKTAGTTWLEEIIGLAGSGGDGLVTAKDVYAQAFDAREELSAPYSAVLDIDPNRLPDPALVLSWDSKQFVRAIRHEPNDPLYNSSMRQLMHVGYKIAAHMGDRYLYQLTENAEAVGACVRDNLFERHLKPLIMGLSNAAL